jgi:hypothetical protein
MQLTNGVCGGPTNSPFTPQPHPRIHFQIPDLFQSSIPPTPPAIVTITYSHQ